MDAFDNYLKSLGDAKCHTDENIDYY